MIRCNDEQFDLRSVPENHYIHATPSPKAESTPVMKFLLPLFLIVFLNLGAQDTIIVCSREEVSFSVDPVPGAIAYQWQRSKLRDPYLPLEETAESSLKDYPSFSGFFGSIGLYTYYRYRVRPVFSSGTGEYTYVGRVHVKIAMVYRSTEVTNLCSLSPNRSTATATLDYANAILGEDTYRVIGLDNNYDVTQTRNPTFTGLPAGRYRSEAWFHPDTCKTQGEEFTITDDRSDYLQVQYTTQYNCDNQSWQLAFRVPASSEASVFEASLDGENFSSDLSFNDLPAGEYTLYVNDLTDCETGRVTVKLQKVEPAVMNTQAAICSNDDGSVIFSGPQGSQPVRSFGYAIYRADTLYRGGNPGQTTFNHLPPGNYTAREYIAGCNSEPLNFTIGQEGDSPEVEFKVTGGACSESITVTAIYTGEEEINYTVNGGPPTSDTKFEFTDAGTYVLEASIRGTDCAKRFTVEFPKLVDFGIVTTDYYTECASGSVSFTDINGGVMPFSYRVDDQEFQASPTVSGLHPGEHTATIKDASGCELSRSFTVADYTYTPEIAGITYLSCSDTPGARRHGAVTISQPEGGGYFTTALFEGWGLDREIGSSVTGAFDMLEEGLYHAIVSLSPTCEERISFDLYEWCSDVELLLEADPVSCRGDSSTLRARLATYTTSSDIEYRLDDGEWQKEGLWDLPGEGHYKVEMRIPGTDTTGFGFIYVPAPEPLRIVTYVPEQNFYSCEDEAGRYFDQLRGGTPPYSVSVDMDSFVPSQEVGPLQPGPHSYVVRDQNGCTLTGQITIEDRRVRPLITAKSDPNCDSTSMGQVSYTLTGQGLQEGSETKLLDVDQDRVLSGYEVDNGYVGLPAGNYRIVHEYGVCRQITDFVIDDAPEPLFTPFADLRACFGTSISVSPPFPVAEIRYYSSDSLLLGSGPEVMLLGGQTITVSGTDTLGCSVSDTFAIEEISEPLTAHFQIEAQTVRETELTLIDQSIPLPDSSSWSIRGPTAGAVQVRDTLNGVVYRFDSVGTYEISHIAYLSNCTDTLLRSIEVVADSSDLVSATVVEGSIRRFQVTPNPTEGPLTVTVELTDPSELRLYLFDASGRLLRNLWSPVSSHHEIHFNLTDLPNGVYAIRLASQYGTSTKTALLQ